tara:strand:+ start:751 stop:1299 length:549 start_codon:yes stop_codon:yes gene_type:complete
MAYYAKRVNGEFVEPLPYGMAALHKEYPNKSFPRGVMEDADFREEYGLVLVSGGEIPTKQGHKAMLTFPVSDGNGGWNQNWNLVPKPENELLPHDFYQAPLADDALLDEHGHIVRMGIDGDHFWSEENQRWERPIVLEDLPYQEIRRMAYGLVEDQLEFITENGLEAWQEKVAEIKGWYPKP